MKLKRIMPSLFMGGQSTKYLLDLRPKLTFLLIFTFQITAFVWSQNITMSIRLKNATLQNLFSQIENKSNYRFFYNNDDIDVKMLCTVDAVDKPIGKILSQALEGTLYTFQEVKDKLILIQKIGMKSNPSITNVGQQISVLGVVTDSKGEYLAGCTVSLKDTKIFTVSDEHGSYSLINIPENSVLQFSFVGMKSQEVAIGNKNIVNIIMESLHLGLEEVVAIGYGKRRRAEVTNAVATVNSDNFIRGYVKDAGQLLRGKIAGLTITTPSGDPTASSQILLRGIATLSTSTQPLILVDGIPGDLNTVVPEDIESIDVLKDGSAAAIYGTRGTNGVILITTRTVKGNIAPTFSYDSYVSTQNYVRIPKMLDAKEYRQKIADGVTFPDLGSTTDWVKEISRKTPLSQVHNFTLKGGNAKTNYLATYNYRNLQGVMLKSDFHTINGRVAVNHNMFDNRLKFTLKFTNNDVRTGVPYGNIGEGLADQESSNVFNQALYRNPTAPIKNPDGSWNEQTSISYYENPLGLLNETYGGYQRQETRISGSVSFEAAKGLLLTALGSRSKSDYESGQGQTKQHLSTIRDGKNGYASKSFGQNLNKLLELTADYTKLFSSHKITALVGYSYQEDLNEYTNLRNWDFPAGNYSYIDRIGAGKRSSVGAQNLMTSSKYESNLIGFFGRLGYNYKEKYLFTANLRYEASSRFIGTKHPWGTFPALSAGWRISEEGFMKQLKFINNLKLRAGFGVTGTAPDELFLGESLLGYGGDFLINGNWVPFLNPISNPNPSLRWEEKKETNIGLDFGILEGRISGSIDYYIRRTNGLLYDYSVPTPPNAFGTTKANVGVMENKGLEILLGFIPIKTNKFEWNSTVTFSTNKNKLVSLENELYKTTNPWFNAGSTGSPISTYTHRVEIGNQIGNFYGYKVVDVTADGKWIYEDMNGKPSETRVEADKKILGNGLPKYYASWNNTFRLGNLDLNITMRGAFDYQILNFQRLYSENPGFTSYNLMSSAFDKVLGKAVLNKNVPVEYNSYYIENGDFWKIDNINLGYNFHKLRIKHIESLRLYATVSNAFIITNYKGMDPEVNALGLTPGNDIRNKYPTTRVYSIGVNVSVN
ncbi:MAG: SusC/RagA family TonB-linked outer membrane protein [Ferruginibacter sp.]